MAPVLDSALTASGVDRAARMRSQHNRVCRNGPCAEAYIGAIDFDYSHFVGTSGYRATSALVLDCNRK